MARTGGKIALALLGLCCVVIPANSHEHATGVVKERMDLMENMGKRMEAINARIKGKAQLAAIKDDARVIAEGATHIAHLFPPGSLQRPTEARAEIWRNFDDFERIAKALEAASRKLAETDIAEFGALSDQARAVSRTCGECHERYRAKR